MNIKLIGLDLDGTLLHEDKTISKKTIEYLESLANDGIEIAPITGRPISGVPKEVREIKGVNYLITSNGSQIRKNKDSKSLFEFALSNDQSKKIIGAIKDFDCMYEVFYDGYGHCEPKVYEHFKKVYTGTPLGEYIFSSRRVVDDLQKVFDTTNTKADEIFIICKDSNHREEISKKTSDIDDLQYCFLADRFLEITKKGVDKGYALETLCNYLNIELKDTIAFGDGENDIEFLQKAGTAVVMQNARDTVKEKADIVTDTNDNDGVLKALMQIFR